MYSYVAPASWLVRRDVVSGRDELNFSEWDDDSDADDAAETVAAGSMPPSRYTLLHPDARHSPTTRDATSSPPSTGRSAATTAKTGVTTPGTSGTEGLKPRSAQRTVLVRGQVAIGSDEYDGLTFPVGLVTTHAGTPQLLPASHEVLERAPIEAARRRDRSET